jgi:hypothetical protein
MSYLEYSPSLEKPAPPGLTDADAVPEAQSDPVSKPGDSWLFGNHKIICGDCTDRDVVTRLLGDAKPQLLVTDAISGWLCGHAATLRNTSASETRNFMQALFCQTETAF